MAVFDNSLYRVAWSVAEPKSESDLYMQLAFRKLDRLFTTGVMGVSNPLKERSKIFACFQEAGKQGNSKGMFLEGVAQADGFGTRKDIDSGMALVTAAALARKCPEALDFLGLLEMQRNPQKAVELFGKATNGGFIMSFRNLGFISLYGEQNMRDAIQYFKAAGEYGKAEIMFLRNHVRKLKEQSLLTAGKPTIASRFLLRA